MDDLSAKLDKLLGSEDGMKRIEDMMTSFGIAPPEAPSSPAPPDDGADLTMMLKLLPAIEAMSQKDDSSELLRALRPHLQHDRQKKLDEATSMMKLVKLLPLLKSLTGKEDSS